jgi:hypothetical protein
MTTSQKKLARPLDQLHNTLKKEEIEIWVGLKRTEVD